MFLGSVSLSPLADTDVTVLPSSFIFVNVDYQSLLVSDLSYTVVHKVFRCFTWIKVAIPLCKNTPLQVKVRHSKLFLKNAVFPSKMYFLVNFCLWYFKWRSLFNVATNIDQNIKLTVEELQQNLRYDKWKIMQSWMKLQNNTQITDNYHILLSYKILYWCWKLYTRERAVCEAHLNVTELHRELPVRKRRFIMFFEGLNVCFRALL